MKFAIYEEFPKDENLSKLVHLDFPVDVIVASKDLVEFQNFERQIRYTNSNVQRVGYWPVLSKEEGYWISPFSKRKALERIICELEEEKRDKGVLLKWDAELPFAINKSLFVSEAKNFLSNKQRIQEFLRQCPNYNLDVLTAEWPTFMLPEVVQESLGVSFNPDKYGCEKGRMIYSSFKKYFYNVVNPKKVDEVFNFLFKKQIEIGVKDYGRKFWVGIGCLAPGIIGTEPLTTLEEFEQDLKAAKENGASNILVFRLGGITPEYVEIIKKYLYR